MVRIWIGNLKFSAIEADVRAALAEFNITPLAIEIRRDPDGNARGFGFVDLRDEDVDTALDEMNGYMLLGRELRIDMATPRRDRPSTGSARR